MKTSLDNALIPAESVYSPLPEFNVPLIQSIPCPNCGSPAERKQLMKQQQTHVECPSCDYLLITCSRTGRVKEAYAPGISWGNR